MTDSVGRVVVAGLSARTGIAVAARFLARGWTVHGTVRRASLREEIGDRVVAAAGGGGDRLRVDLLDLADGEGVERFGDVVGNESSVDALVVTAAPFAERAWSGVTGQDLVDQARVQAIGPAMLAKSLEPALRRGEGGRTGAVVFFGDIHARLRPRRGALPYLAGKALVESLVPMLALEMAPIRVFGMAPGVIAWADEFDEDRRRDYLERVPLGREGTLDEAAAMVESLVCTMTYTTGVVLPIDGGRSLR